MTTTLDHLVYVGLDHLHPADDNPRAELGPLDELANTIEQHGIIEPLVVIERTVGGGYTIVAGHRRAAAARIAGLGVVPCVVRTFDSTESRIEAMVVENLARADLTPLDEARAFRMLAELGQTQRDIAERVGCSQSHVSRRLSLAKLPEAATNMLTAGRLTVRQAEQLADLPEADIGEIVELVRKRAAWRPDGEAVADFDVEQSIKGLASQRKHDKIEAVGKASGCVRLKDKPWVGAGDHRPCKRSEATHWYLGSQDSTITWARTAKADNEAKGTTSTGAGAGPTSDQRDAERELQRAKARQHDEDAERRKTRLRVMITGDATDRATVVRVAMQLLVDQALTEMWGTEIQISRRNFEEDRIDIAALTDDPALFVAVGVLMRHAYIEDDDEGYEPERTAWSSLWWEDETPAPADAPGITDEQWETPERVVDPQAAWEAERSMAMVTRRPWKSYVRDATTVIVAEVSAMATVDDVRQVIAFERRNTARSEVLDAARARLDELAGATS